MKCDTNNCRSRDILSHRWQKVLLFWLPIAAIVITASSRFGTGWRLVAWTAALGTMGVACLVNAFRCGRVHCYLTGPFFLLMALATLLFGFGLLPLEGNGWNLLGMILLAGAVLLCCLPELLFGKYRAEP
jgi:uncharacterized membrane protein HdeD (DUF308 family)